MTIWYVHGSKKVLFDYQYSTGCGGEITELLTLNL